MTAPQGIRRGALSLAGMAPVIRADLRKGRTQDAVRLLFGFADDFRGSSPGGQAALLREEPPSTSDRGFDAALAGEAEFFAREAGLPAPEWVDGPGRFAEPWWFIASSPAFHAYVLARTPAVFFRHGVFVAREVFDRV